MRPQLRLGVLLSLIAVIGLSLTVLAEGRGSLARQAEFHAQQALFYRMASRADLHAAELVGGKVPSLLSVFLDPSSARDHRVLSSLNAARSDYHAALWLKYERAAQYPWRPIAPDPPPPP